jgi:hypothetical protein
MEFKLEPEDAGKMGQTREAPASSRSPAPKKRPSKLRPEGSADSGVRVVPLDKASDSDVKIVSDDRGHDPSVILGQSKSKTPSDSDVRLELAPPTPPGRGRDDAFITEDIELDLEALKEEESKVKRRRPTKSSPEHPITSPFELSDDDAPKAGGKPKAKSDTDSSSDFELTAAGSSDHSPIELGSDEMPIPLAGDHEEEVILGEVGGPGSHDSGINLRDARDSGISLEEGGSEEIEFAAASGPTATPKPGPVTPKPAGSAEHDSSAEFELSMDDSPVGEDHSSSEFELSLDPGTGPEESSSEFELSLDPNATSASKSHADDSSPVDSDSEFELSLDASGEQDSARESGLSEGEKDIFETDFEVPALDDESGSEAVALDESDTDLEDSDFELDLSDEDLAAEEESGSQAVALEEESESGSSAEVPVSRKPRKKPVADSSEETDAPLIDLEDMEGEESEVESEAEPVAAGPGAPPAPWGVVPALFLVPSFIVMIFVVFMSYEMLNTMWGYHTGSIGARMLLNPLAKQIDKDVP